MEKKFKRDFKSLDSVFNFISEFFNKEHIDKTVLFSVNFIIEEIFTNMVKYNSEGKSDILLDLNREEKKILIKLIDFDSEPFDLTQKEEADTTLTLNERTPGGLGIHLVKKMADDVKYEYQDRQSKIVITKNLE